MKRAKYYMSQWDLIYRVKGGQIVFWVNERVGWMKSACRPDSFSKHLETLEVRQIRKPKHLR